MSSLDLEFDFDARVTKLEVEWRQAFEANVSARAYYHALAAKKSVALDVLDQARERLERSEALKSQILDRIDRLERRFTRRS